jgi:hypothetical protein
MTSVFAQEEIKKDVEDLIKVAIEDEIPGEKINTIFKLVPDWKTDYPLRVIEKYVDREISASAIIGRTLISRRFADKIISLISKYYHHKEDRQLFEYCASLLYNEKRPSQLSQTIDK